MFTYIPMPVIASILINSAFRLIPTHLMLQLFKEDKSELVVLIITTMICIFGDGALGLIAGGFIALMRNAANNNQGYISFQEDGDVLVVTIAG
jgi:MFS superfamily sulfate permease-like transporter